MKARSLRELKKIKSPKRSFVVTPSGVIFKETPEGVTTNIWMIYILQSPKYSTAFPEAMPEGVMHQLTPWTLKLCGRNPNKSPHQWGLFSSLKR